MIKKLLSFSMPLLVAAMCVSTAAITGCEKAGGEGSSGSSGGGGGSSSAVGSWKCTSFEGNPNSGFYWHFNSDGSFTLNQSTSNGGGRCGSYNVSGNRITGNGTNPGVGTFEIDFTLSGNTFTGDFFEHWGGGKHVPITAVRQ